ncbi:nuclear transport factor 2 family protein [Leucobacter sp. Z1108]|uniref:nuclear transport factor 2 family protein n=1 Tax=Leucobacter sp. Z1108 TaxID=3439066 RepID=UPI003F29F8ED
MSNAAFPAPGWSTRAERTRIAPEVPRDTAEEALDRLLIVERINRYGWAFDERRLDLLVDCFTENGTWEGSVLGVDDYGPYVGQDEIRRFIADFFPLQNDHRRHQFSNFVIEFENANYAVAHAYLVLWGSENDCTRAITAGPYRFVAVRDNGVWRISELHGGWDSHF